MLRRRGFGTYRNGYGFGAHRQRRWRFASTAQRRAAFRIDEASCPTFHRRRHLQLVVRDPRGVLNPLLAASTGDFAGMPMVQADVARILSGVPPSAFGAKVRFFVVHSDVEVPPGFESQWSVLSRDSRTGHRHTAPHRGRIAFVPQSHTHTSIRWRWRSVLAS